MKAKTLKIYGNMKKIILLLILSLNAFAQGGPNGPPNPACNSPNPPPWCDNPTVPIDNWPLMVVLFTTAGIMGYTQIKKMEINVERKLD
jgi:hypothetical protein